MILQVSDLSKSYGTDVIFSGVSFNIEENEKAALIGINGAGKSTLFKIIVGDETADSGTVTLGKDKKLGYLAQHQEFDSDNTIYDEILQMKKDILELEQRMRSLELAMKDAGEEELETLMKQYSNASHIYELNNGYAYKSEVVGVLKGLGFSEDEFGKVVTTLSGGQKTRVSLAKLLLTKPDIILLDEPTNHLDLPSIAWLENYLANYPGAVLIIAHDRYFLNKIAGKIIDLENGKARVYQGNYDDFAAKKAVIRKSEMNAWLKQQDEIKHQEEVIAKLKSFNREKSIKRAESREKMLDKIERLDKPAPQARKLDIRLTPRIMSGGDVLTVKNLAKSYDGNMLFSDFSMLLKRGERLVIVGANGSGKTTLLKILRGLVPADEGSFNYGAKVYSAYYDQEQQVLDPDKTVFDELHDTYPEMTNTELRNTLAAFLFTGDDVFKQIRDLSGGEKGRVSLAKLMLSDSNLLILDEPTNHLDIDSKEILEEALCSYEGTVICVSHDRYFINRTATRILDLSHGRFVAYDGDYDYYLDKRDMVETRLFGAVAAKNPVYSSEEKGKLSSSFSANDTNGDRLGNRNILAGTGGLGVKNDSEAADLVNVSLGKLDWAKQKEAEAAKRKRASKIERLEKEIDKLEQRIAEIDKEIQKPEIASNSYELTKLTKEQEELNEKLLSVMDEWEQASTD